MDRKVLKHTRTSVERGRRYNCRARQGHDKEFNVSALYVLRSVPF